MGFEARGTQEKFDLSDLGLTTVGRDAAFDGICRLAARSMMASVAVLCIGDPTEGRLVIKGGFGLNHGLSRKGIFQLGTTLIETVLDKPKLMRVAGIAPEDRTYAEMAALRAESVLAVPVHGPAGEPIGMLAVLDHEPRTWTDEDVRLVRESGRIVTRQVLLKAALETLKRMAQGPGRNVPASYH